MGRREGKIEELREKASWHLEKARKLLARASGLESKPLSEIWIMVLGIVWAVGTALAITYIYAVTGGGGYHQW